MRMKKYLKNLCLMLCVGILVLNSVAYAEVDDDITYHTDAEEQGSLQELPDVTADTIEAEILPSGIHVEGVSYAAFQAEAYDGSFRNQLTPLEASFYDDIAGIEDPQTHLKENSVDLSTVVQEEGLYTTKECNSGKYKESEIYKNLFAQVMRAMDAYIRDDVNLYWCNAFGAGIRVHFDHVENPEDPSGYYYQVSYTIFWYFTAYYEDIIAEMPETEAALNELRAETAAKLLANPNRYQIILAIQDSIAELVSYPSTNLSAQYYHTITGALLDKYGHQVVCEGYSRLFSILCHDYEIPVMNVEGYSYSGGSLDHMWNYVQMEDGKWYLIDLTWNDDGEIARTTWNLRGGNTTIASGNHVPAGRLFYSREYEKFTLPVLADSTYTDELSANCKHTDGEWVTVKEAGETEGKEALICQTCGSILQKRAIPATCDNGHSWGEYVKIKEATCTEDGIEERTCSKCGAKEERAIAATGHDWSAYVVKKAATCTEDGIEERTCSKCGAKEEKAIAATGHNWSGYVVKKAATGKTTGVEESTCRNCGEVRQRIIPKLTQKQMVEAYVTRLYTLVLNRKPDNNGLNAWVSQLMNGNNTGAEAAQGFIFSDEYLNKKVSNAEYVEMLYNTMMGRKSDAAGKAAWVKQLDNGCTRLGIMAGFVGSREFSEICNEYGILRGDITSDAVTDQNPDVTAFVCRMYTVVLGRNYDPNGLNAWTAKLLNRELGGGELSMGFFHSQEFLLKAVSDRNFVTICYRTYLNREPDAAGLESWLVRLQAGDSRDQILDGFIYSIEYGELCASYGINR